MFSMQLSARLYLEGKTKERIIPIRYFEAVVLKYLPLPGIAPTCHLCVDIQLKGDTEFKIIPTCVALVDIVSVPSEVFELGPILPNLTRFYTKIISFGWKLAKWARKSIFFTHSHKMCWAKFSKCWANFATYGLRMNTEYSKRYSNGTWWEHKMSQLSSCPDKCCI